MFCSAYYVFIQNKNNWKTIQGNDYPLGVTYIKEGDAFNFALYSKHATKITLLLYKDNDLILINRSYSPKPSAETLRALKGINTSLQAPDHFQH
jgi:pullulanase/glycogen debranching enzyme